MVRIKHKPRKAKGVLHEYVSNTSMVSSIQTLSEEYYRTKPNHNDFFPIGAGNGGLAVMKTAIMSPIQFKVHIGVLVRTPK